VALGIPGASGGMVGAQAILGIPQYNMTVKYDLIGYAAQAALPDVQQTLMDASVESVDGDIVLKFKKFLVEEGENDIIVDGPQNFIYAYADTVGEGHGSNRGKAVINLLSGGTSKVSDPDQGKWLAHGILAGLAWGFLTPLAVGAALLKDFLPPGPTWFKIHMYCNSLNFFFTITAFALAVHVLEKAGRKHFSFAHASMGLAIFILVIFQVLAAYNRPHLPPAPEPKREDDEMEGGTANEEPVPSPGKSKIRISWEILHRLFGAALMACSFWQIDAGLILYDTKYPESDALVLGRKIFWSWIGIWGAVVMSGLVWKKINKKSGN